MPPQSPVLEFNYDISCPFAYIASTRVQSLAARTGATLHYRPVLLGAIYRATSAPQGAAGSASDVFNSAKKAVTKTSMARTLRRYCVAYNPPPEHPRKSVAALRLLYAVPDGPERAALTDALFAAYWADRVDVTDERELLRVARASGIASAAHLELSCFKNAAPRVALEEATAAAIERGAFGVPGFWIPDACWTDASGTAHTGRFYWGQDRMHFVEATLLALAGGSEWTRLEGLARLIPRSLHSNTLPGPTRLEFWFDFSSPWAYLGYTQLGRLQALFGPQLEIVLKPFLLGILFREIGAPNMPMLAVSKAKMLWSRQDHADWTAWWNAVQQTTGSSRGAINFQWASAFPIRTPSVLRVAIVEPKTIPVLYAACWSQDANVSDDAVLTSVLDTAGFNGADLLSRANAPGPKAALRALTAEAKQLGICGVPTYRVLRQDASREWMPVGGLVWGQDEAGVLEDLIAGWDGEAEVAVAGVRAVGIGSEKAAKL